MDSLLKSLKQFSESNWATESDQELAHDFIQFVQSYPSCFERTLEIGHLTASCWLWNPEESACLFTLHKKLGKWLQLGGHADGEKDLLKVSIKEAQEESGITQITPVMKEIFDLSIHNIPAYKDTPAHLHYDVRYLLKAEESTDFVVSAESHDLRWIQINDFDQYNLDPSILKMRDKLTRLPSNFSL